MKPGYAKNFLVPEGKATLASEAKIREVEHLRRQIAEKVAKELSDLKKAKKALEALVLEVTAKAGEEGKLFGSVTAGQVAELIAAKRHRDRPAQDRARRSDQGARRAQGERCASTARWSPR